VFCLILVKTDLRKVDIYIDAIIKDILQIKPCSENSRPNLRMTMNVHLC